MILKECMNNKEYPIISIIIPVYNKRNYLTAAVKSASNQKLANGEDIEIIIIDDGSIDGSSELADELAKSDNRIKVVHQQNQWIYASFNNGIREARGEYIYILNADDMLVEDSLQLLISKIKEYDYPDVIWTTILNCKVDKNQNVITQSKANDGVTEELYFCSINDIHNNWIFLQKTALVQNQANLYRRTIALEHPFRNDYYGADSFFNLSIANSIGRMVILPKEVYKFYEYESVGMNASIGKYYDYEHVMFNLLYEQTKKLYIDWGIQESVFLDYIVEKRLHELTHEILVLNYNDCKMTMKEKIKHVMSVCADSLIRNEASKVGREREYESRLLNGTSKLLSNTDVLDDDYCFIKILLDALPKDYKENIKLEELDCDRINFAVNHVNNIDKIGRVYYSTNWD